MTKKKCRSNGTLFLLEIFFCVEDESEQILYFTRAILKQEKNPPEFERLIQESEQIVLMYTMKTRLSILKANSF
ncbi:hypothetical protein HUG20_10475 [Salicibibacter cibi]|uniref:Uncharacterized protein n=1 Tax=Salicibibacter cibi TaxID=2743001 RepID=A0A7T6ZBK9_9BACI|nr:hypothetical protein [Salicibibacter cibi]QQK80275.1 hypothetical protein HUG20_10475 [Salicibibacter cibi]